MLVRGYIGELFRLKNAVESNNGNVLYPQPWGDYPCFFTSCRSLLGERLKSEEECFPEVAGDGSVILGPGLKLEL